MNFRSIAQLSDQLLRWSRELPRDIEVVAGIPRSGLLAANILALYLNVPLTDVEGLLQGRCYPSGARRRKLQKDTGGLVADDEYLATPRRVLVVDDSVLGGRAMRKARARIEAGDLPHAISYAAVYVTSRRQAEVDYLCELLNPPRVFEWNLFHIGLLEEMHVSFEGVLCPPMPAGIADHDGRLANFLADAQPLVVPSRDIGCVVVTLHSRHRALVEEWLGRHGCAWRDMVFADAPPAAGAAPVFKAQTYRGSEALLYLEDSMWEAVQIARLAGRQVLCTSTMQVVEPGAMPLRRTDPPVDLHPPAWSATMTDRVTSFGRDLVRRVLPGSARSGSGRG